MRRRRFKVKLHLFINYQLFWSFLSHLINFAFFHLSVLQVSCDWDLMPECLPPWYQADRPLCVWSVQNKMLEMCVICNSKLFVGLLEGGFNIWLTFYSKRSSAVSTQPSNNPSHVSLVSPPKCSSYRHSNTQRAARSFKLCNLPCLKTYCKYHQRSQKVLSNPVERRGAVCQKASWLDSKPAWKHVSLISEILAVTDLGICNFLI